jgi:pyrrolysine biosynthesis protein PylC
MDEVFDCKRVRAPSNLSPEHQSALAGMARRLAEALSIKGLMDVEVVLYEDRLYLLEIDARIPSQTPTAVYWATGVNLIALLGNLFIPAGKPVSMDETPDGAVVYEHIRVNDSAIHVCGEHWLGRAGPLKLVSDFFGCDEAITDFQEGRAAWAATLICCGSDPAEAWHKRCTAVERIRTACCPGAVDPPTGGHG